MSKQELIIRRRIANIIGECSKIGTKLDTTECEGDSLGIVQEIKFWLCWQIVYVQPSIYRKKGHP